MLDSKTIEIIKSTIPVLEEHGEKITTRFYQLMFENHPELLNIFNHVNQQQGRQQKALAGTVYAAAKYIDNLEAIIPVVKQIAHKHRSIGIKPEQYPIVGKHLLLAIQDVLGDHATPEIIHAWERAYAIIADAFISVEADMYDQASSQKGGWKDFRSFIVTGKVKESDVITSFYLKPEDGKEIADFIPGQYVSLHFNIDGEKYNHIRQYSLSDTPGKDYYRISVKREDGNKAPDGIVSNYLHNQVEVGDTLQVSAPAGDFVLHSDSLTPVVLISGGVGITPMLSMLNTIVEREPDRKVTFIHAAANSKVHAMRDHLAKISNEKQNVTSYLFYDSPTEEDRQSKNCDFEGFISYEWLKEQIEFNEETDFYFCGPVPFMKSVYQSLNKLGIREDKIHFEFFGPMGSLAN
ncbi:NO-inducible flavohemoprotein [Bacillus sp. V3-13]|uniref:NO-inducible flavohemoprotein n=1 Tax=Bacillus sp. V3-13 TaxID=2053728 RepID=UPI000C763A15|nr:NO-inducible flavohemoprotein [Bacillus sp. V3-13]PLR76199.1 NO-inducible flavohemoprotein [Bacillus sp. V3-13]